MIDTLVRRKGGGAVRSPLDSDPHQDAAKALFANFRLQPEAEAASQRRRTLGRQVALGFLTTSTGV